MQRNVWHFYPAFIIYTINAYIIGMICCWWMIYVQHFQLNEVSMFLHVCFKRFDLV